MVKIVEKLRRVIFLVLGVGLYLNLSLFSDESLILHLKMDEGKGNILNDSSGYYNDGKIYGAKWIKDEEIGRYVLAFDGEDDYVKLGSVAQGRTIEVWFKTEITDKECCIFHNACGWVGHWPIMNITKKGTLWVMVRNFKDSKRLESKTLVNTGEWIQAVFTCDDTYIYLYINGKLERKVSYEFPIIKCDYTTIGALYQHYIKCVISEAEAGRKDKIKEIQEYIKRWKKKNPGKKYSPSRLIYTNYFSGAIGTVRVYDKTLSAEEIKKLYEKGIK